MDHAPDDPWHKSWVMIHASAWWSLNHASDLPPSISGEEPFHGIPRLRLWDDAKGFRRSTPEPTTYTVYELLTEQSRVTMVRQTEWHRSVDLSRIRQDAITVIDPTLVVHDALVDSTRLTGLLQEASRFQVPVVSLRDEDSITTCVGAVGFEFFSRDQPPAVLRLEWSSEIPSEWQPMIEWYQRLRQFLEDCFPAT